MSGILPLIHNNQTLRTAPVSNDRGGFLLFTAMSVIARFNLQASDGSPVPAEAAFVDAASCRRITASLPQVSPQGRPVDDAIEFVQLAAKRWRYYQRTGFTVTNLAALKARIQAEPACEVGLMLAVFLPDGSAAGGCFARRTWAGNIMLDFLFAHPRGFTRDGRAPSVKGTGAGIMAALAVIVLETGGRELWGEATENSCGFYNRLKARLSGRTPHQPIKDRFIFGQRELRLLARQTG